MNIGTIIDRSTPLFSEHPPVCIDTNTIHHGKATISATLSIALENRMALSKPNPLEWMVFYGGKIHSSVTGITLPGLRADAGGVHGVDDTQPECFPKTGEFMSPFVKRRGAYVSDTIINSAGEDRVAFAKNHLTRRRQQKRLESVSKMSFSPISALEPRFKSSIYLSHQFHPPTGPNAVTRRCPITTKGVVP